MNIHQYIKQRDEQEREKQRREALARQAQHERLERVLRGLYGTYSPPIHQDQVEKDERDFPALKELGDTLRDLGYAAVDIYKKFQEAKNAIT